MPYNWDKEYIPEISCKECIYQIIVGAKCSAFLM